MTNHLGLPQKEIQKAAHFLRAGELVAFPTETVYGLGGNALSDHAVAAIYIAKGRPSFNPLIVHVRSLEEAAYYGEISDNAKLLAKHFWPGPMTLVLPRRDNCALSLLVSAGMDTVAVRVPAHPIAQALMAEAKLPIAAPSANLSGKISPTDAVHVRDELGDRIAMILDGGPCHVGIESTVIDVTANMPMILRPGSVTLNDIRPLLPTISISQSTTILAPGMMQSHYAPASSMRLSVQNVYPDEALLAFGTPLDANAHSIENLSESGSIQEAAANLFRMLRKLDESGARCIAVMPIPEQGLGVAINDRLTRAAAPK